MTKNKHTAWFVHDRFGLFIHWGIFSMAARHEWIKHIESIADADYQKYFNYFNPNRYNPKEWAEMAKEAGMKYVVITTKHHDGFCLWDSQHTDYKVTNTPYGKDALREFVDAFRAAGLKMGLYYSIDDWHHPDFPMNRLHPDLERPEIKEKERTPAQYASYMRDQVRELLTEYGKVDLFWFDGAHEWARLDDGEADLWDSEKLMTMIRELQPGIVVNDRLYRERIKRPDCPEDTGDIKTPEQDVPSHGIRGEDGELLVWEGCQTLSGAWGYYRDELTWKTVEELVQMLINHVSRGGNMLLNVGPNARGEFDSRARHALEGLAEWMSYHDSSIYGCTVAPEWFKEPENCRCTYNPETNRLYIHCLVWPFRSLHVANLAGKIDYAQLLSDHSEIPFTENDDDVCLELHGKTPLGALTVPRPTMMKPDVSVPVIEVMLK